MYCTWVKPRSSLWLNTVDTIKSTGSFFLRSGLSIRVAVNITMCPKSMKKAWLQKYQKVGQVGRRRGTRLYCVLAVKPIHVVAATEAVVLYNRVDLHTKQQVWNKALTVKYVRTGMFSN